MSAYASVDLPDPFGPMIAWTSFGSTTRSTPLTISVPSSSATCRFLISSSAKFVRPSALVEWRKAAEFVTHTLPVGRRPPSKPRYPQLMPLGISWWEILLLLLVILLVFGPKRLPEAGKSLGKGIREFKDSLTGNDDDEKRQQLPPPPPTEDAVEPVAASTKKPTA